jgi:hypothetical protein
MDSPHSCFHYGLKQKEHSLKGSPRMPTRGTVTMIAEWQEGSTLPNAVVHSPVKMTILRLYKAIIVLFAEDKIYCLIFFAIICFIQRDF